MNIGALLPHVYLFGGVKRFFELGAVLQEKGHSFTIYTPDGIPPLWSKNEVRVASFEQLKSEKQDILFFTEKGFFDLILKTNARYKVFYHVRQGDKVRKIVSNRNIQVFACSTNIYNYDKFWYRVAPFLAIGGINSKLYKSKNIEIGSSQNSPFIVMAYGRLVESRKGTMYVVKACEKLYIKYPNIRLLLFDTPINNKMEEAIKRFKTFVPYEFILNHPVDKNTELYHKADIFVSAEKNAGWANTVAEAMASGIPVIATKSGTLDMIIDNKTGVFVKRNVRSIYKAIEKLILSPEKRNDLSVNGRKHIERYDWHILAENIINWYSQKESAV
jgi:glycosyltransferase involved in cell wall biosynthesis